MGFKIHQMDILLSCQLWISCVQNNWNCYGDFFLSLLHKLSWSWKLYKHYFMVVFNWLHHFLKIVKYWIWGYASLLWLLNWQFGEFRFLNVRVSKASKRVSEIWKSVFWNASSKSYRVQDWVKLQWMCLHVWLNQVCMLWFRVGAQ